MAYLVAIGLALTLFGGFVVLTYWETTTGVRLLKGVRSDLDRKAARLAFIAKHVDWGSFAKHVLATLSARVAHDVAHVTLRIVRTVERLLTRVVRNLRTPQEGAPATPAPKFDVRSALTQLTPHLKRSSKKSGDEPPAA